MLIIFITILEFKKAIHSGGLLFLFWFILTIVDIIPFRSKILHTLRVSISENNLLMLYFHYLLKIKYHFQVLSLKFYKKIVFTFNLFLGISKSRYFPICYILCVVWCGFHRIYIHVFC